MLKESFVCGLKGLDKLNISIEVSHDSNFCEHELKKPLSKTPVYPS